MAARLLSPREREVTERRGRGQSFKAIAADLGVKIGTVSSYQARAVEKALEKLDVDTIEQGIGLAENLLVLFRQTPEGAAVTIAPRLSREDLGALMTAFEAIARGAASGLAVLHRIEEAHRDDAS